MTIVMANDPEECARLASLGDRAAADATKHPGSGRSGAEGGIPSETWGKLIVGDNSFVDAVINQTLRASACKFTDWHISIDRPTEGVLFPGPKVVPEPLIPVASMLAAEVKRQSNNGKRRQFSVVVAGQIRFRIQMMSNNHFAARLSHSTIPVLTELGYAKGFTDLLLSDDLKRTGGLVLVTGLTGAGKTTTATALVTGRLEKFGGYALTIEDPPEYPINGFHGRAGFCEQIDSSDEGYETKTSEAMRCFPARDSSMLLYGEVRTSEVAAELLRIGVDGHLVISTMHAGDIISGLNRLKAMASHAGEAEARNLLANCLKLVIHQRIDNGIPQMSALQVTEQVSAMIFNNKVDNLKDAIAATHKRAGVMTR